MAASHWLIFAAVLLGIAVSVHGQTTSAVCDKLGTLKSNLTLLTPLDCPSRKGTEKCKLYTAYHPGPFKFQLTLDRDTPFMFKAPFELNETSSLYDYRVDRPELALSVEVSRPNHECVIGNFSTVIANRSWIMTMTFKRAPGYDRMTGNCMVTAIQGAFRDIVGCPCCINKDFIAITYDEVEEAGFPIYIPILAGVALLLVVVCLIAWRMYRYRQKFKKANQEYKEAQGKVQDLIEQDEFGMLGRKGEGALQSNPLHGQKKEEDIEKAKVDLANIQLKERLDQQREEMRQQQLELDQESGTGFKATFNVETGGQQPARR